MLKARASRTIITLWSASLTLVMVALAFGMLLPGGDQIAYAAGQPHSDIYLLDVARGLSARVSPFPNQENIEPAWSPDGKRIAFMSRLDNTAPFHLYIMDVEQKRVQAIAPDLRVDGLPAWSPDGHLIAFPVIIDGSTQTAIAQADSLETYIVNLTSGSDSPSMWSPDGKWVMYLSYRDGYPRLYAAEVNCNQRSRGCRFNDERILWTVGLAAWPPSWSPDGHTLAFTAALTSDSELYLAESECMAVITDCMVNAHPITDNTSVDYTPIWSMDGKQIAFISIRDGLNNLYLMTVEDGDTRQLTTQGVMSDFAWSADGTQIAFEALNGGKPGIIVIHIESGNTRLLTSKLIVNSGLAWRPIGK